MRNWRSWRTTLCGILSIASGLAGFVICLRQPDSAATVFVPSLGAITTGVGLMYAKDFDVTGR